MIFEGSCDTLYLGVMLKILLCYHSNKWHLKYIKIENSNLYVEIPKEEHYKMCIQCFTVYVYTCKAKYIYDYSIHVQLIVRD